MTDNLRQDATDKAESTLKPDSQKSTLEYAQDQVKSAADSIAGTLQPQGQKSAGQKVTDSVSGTGSEGKGILEQAQEYAADAIKTVQETLGLGGESGSSAK